MKVGDLVRLSAYGRKRLRASWIDRDDVGIIVEIIPRNWTPDDYKVHWTKTLDSKCRRWSHERFNTRTDLMYVR